MSNERDIKQAIRAIAGGGAKRLVMTGTVGTVDGESCTVDVGGLELSDVRLSPVCDGKNGKLLLAPKEGSIVLVTDLSEGTLRDLAVTGYTELESVTLSAERIEINGGENGGMVNIEELKDWMRKVVGDLAMLKTLLATAPIAGNGLPAAIGFSPQATSVPDMEDTKITH